MKQRWINYLVMWKYVQYIHEICDRQDFRTQSQLRAVQLPHVVTAFPFALHWLKLHPECIVAG